MDLVPTWVICVHMLRAHSTCNVIFNTINMTRFVFVIVYLRTVFAWTSNVISEQLVVMDDEGGASVAPF
jgi:hypothetical protein